MNTELLRAGMGCRASPPHAQQALTAKPLALPGQAGQVVGKGCPSTWGLCSTVREGSSPPGPEQAEVEPSKSRLTCAGTAAAAHSIHTAHTGAAAESRWPGYPQQSSEVAQAHGIPGPDHVCVHPPCLQRTVSPPGGAGWDSSHHPHPRLGRKAVPPSPLITWQGPGEHCPKSAPCAPNGLGHTHSGHK